MAIVWRPCDLTGGIAHVAPRYFGLSCTFVLILAGALHPSNSWGQQTIQPDLGSQKAGASEEPNSSHPEDEPPPENPVTATGLTYSDPVAVRWKVGVTITASAADVTNIILAIPIPNDWPEQSVSLESEQMPNTIGRITYGNLDSGVRRQMIKIPVLKAGDTFEITTTFRVSTSQINAAADTTQFRKADTKHKQAKGYLTPNQYISFQNSKLRKQVSSLVADKENVWQEVESIYDWVRENIDQKDLPSANSVKTFLKKEGNEEDKVAIFVAMCRFHKIPARMVWVDGGIYAEFMLVDAQDQAVWFPCNLVGVREFGSISEPRIILQKGEYIKVPEKSERQKFVAEHMSCQTMAKPTVEFIRELLPATD